MKIVHFLWIDCEMTGLDVSIDHILELACFITDQDMNILAEYQAVIYHNYETLKNMNEWCQATHSSSGLIDAVKRSRLNYQKVESAVLQLLTQYAVCNNTYIAGNSVYTDLNFIKKYMPKIVDFLHYRIFDMSSFKIMAEIQGLSPFIKMKKHLALDDIRESMAEYAYYKNLLIK